MKVIRTVIWDGSWTGYVCYVPYHNPRSIAESSILKHIFSWCPLYFNVALLKPLNAAHLRNPLLACFFHQLILRRTLLQFFFLHRINHLFHHSFDLVTIFFYLLLFIVDYSCLSNKQLLLLKTLCSEFLLLKI